MNLTTRFVHLSIDRNVVSVCVAFHAMAISSYNVTLGKKKERKKGDPDSVNEIGWLQLPDSFFIINFSILN